MDIRARSAYLTYNAAWIAASVGAPLLTVALASRSLPAAGRTLAGRIMRYPGCVMGYLGRRSYALYLWHYVWLTWLRDLRLPGIALALFASLASAELSWRLVEAPAMRL